MKTKVTLTMGKVVVETAKEYAESKGTSLSNLVESYLKSLKLDDVVNNEKTELSTLIQSLKGSFKAPEGFNYKSALECELLKKYKI